MERNFEIIPHINHRIDGATVYTVFIHVPGQKSPVILKEHVGNGYHRGFSEKPAAEKAVDDFYLKLAKEEAAKQPPKTYRNVPVTEQAELF